MKDITTEQKIIAARPDDFESNKHFVDATMLAVKQSQPQTSFASSYLKTGSLGKKNNLIYRLRRLPSAALIALIIGTLIFAGGAVYAAVRFAPDLIKIFSKEKSDRGTTEYKIPEFLKCLNPVEQQTSTFELKKDAPKLSDEEVTKIVQARCELSHVNQLVSNEWPKEKLNSDETAGGLHYVTSIGQPTYFENIKDGVINTYYSGDRVYKTASPISKTMELKAYSAGKQINVKDVKKGDAVILVWRDIEEHLKDGPGDSAPAEYIGIIKLSLPLEYYQDKQIYLTDINECYGNAGEKCPNTGYIDVFPSGEGMGGNSQLKIDEGMKLREISGRVTSLGTETLELKSSSGATYFISAPKNTFRDYNDIHAKNHLDGDASLKIDSRIIVRYYKYPGASGNKIISNEIEHIGLLIDAVDYKQKTPKQY